MLQLLVIGKGTKERRKPENSVQTVTCKNSRIEMEYEISVFLSLPLNKLLVTVKDVIKILFLLIVLIKRNYYYYYVSLIRTP